MNYDNLIVLRQNLKTALDSVDELIRTTGKGKNINDLSPDKRIDYIINTVFSYANLPSEMIESRRKEEGIVAWKRICGYILTDYAGISLHKAKVKLNYKQHQSVMFHRNKMRVWMKEPRYAPKGVFLATKNILTQLGYE